MEKSRDRAPDVDAAGALLGEPVDPRRPVHMSRDQYLRADAGELTSTALKTAGLSREARRRRWGWVLIAAATVVAAVLVLWSASA